MYQIYYNKLLLFSFETECELFYIFWLFDTVVIDISINTHSYNNYIEPANVNVTIPNKQINSSAFARTWIVLFISLYWSSINLKYMHLHCHLWGFSLSHAQASSVESKIEKTSREWCWPGRVAHCVWWKARLISGMIMESFIMLFSL